MKFSNKEKPFGMSCLLTALIEKRKEESGKLSEQYPDRIPIICEKYKGSSAPDLDKSRYSFNKYITA